MLGRAPRAERRAVGRLDEALHDAAALTVRGLVGGLVRHAEALFGIELAIGLGQAKAALRDLAHAAPLSRHHLEHARHELARRQGAVAPDRARVLVLYFGPPLFALLHAPGDTLPAREPPEPAASVSR